MNKIVVVTISFGISFSLMFISFAAAGALKLSRNAFSDPAYKVAMPEDWKRQGIKHESWAEGSDLAVSSDQHLYPAVLPIINKFAQDNKLKIAVKEAVCGITKGRLARKAVDVTTDCCPPGPGDRLPGIKFYTVGIAPLAVLANVDNPVDNITYNEARSIFQGKVRKWSEVRGRNVAIHPVTRLHCKDRPGMWRLMLPSEELFGTDIHDVKTINDMIVSVANDPNAIGFESLWQVKNHKQGARVKALKIDGHDPADPAALESGAYPLYLTYVITIWEGEGLEKPHAKQLAGHIMKEIEKVKKPFYIVTAQSLKKAGWKFRDYELIGEKKGRK